MADELEQKLILLENRIKQLEKNTGFQLKFPLDVISKRIIKNIIILPITVKLKGTDAATAGNYGKFFVNSSDLTLIVVAISEVHGTAGSHGSAVTLQIERLQGTEALGSGDALLSSTFNLKGTADTVQHGTLISNSQLLVLEKWDRLALKDAGTLTAVADVCVTVMLKL